MPYDLEMSNQELHYNVMKAEAWRGEEGERRKVAVYDYIWEEEDVGYFASTLVLYILLLKLLMMYLILGSSPIQGPRCFLEQETLHLLLSNGWFQERI